MANYQIQVNEKMAAGRNLVALLKSLPDMVTVEKSKPTKQSKVYKSVASGFRDVRDIIDGKQEAVTLKDFLETLPICTFRHSR